MPSGFTLSEDSMRFITQMEYGSNHCFWVRFQRGDFICKSFPYLRYGGKEAARRAAQEWRDENEHRMRPPLGGVEVPPGHHYFRTAEYRGYPHRFCWLRIEDRRAKVARRGIHTHGEVQAQRLCEQWLEEQMQALLARLRARQQWRQSKSARRALDRFLQSEGLA